MIREIVVIKFKVANYPTIKDISAYPDLISISHYGNDGFLYIKANRKPINTRDTIEQIGNNVYTIKHLQRMYKWALELIDIFTNHFTSVGAECYNFDAYLEVDDECYRYMDYKTLEKWDVNNIQWFVNYDDEGGFL